MDSGFSYAYYPPPNAVKIRRLSMDKCSFADRVEVHADDEVYFREVDVNGVNQIHTHADGPYCEYTRNPGIDASFSGSFARLVAAILAKDAGPGIITNNFAKLQSRLEKNIMDWRSQAIAEDVVRRPQQSYPESPFIKVRSAQQGYY